MRVLGIDPGTKTAGYGVVEKKGNRLTALSYGAIKTGRNDSFPDRLKTIYDGLREVIAQYKPDAVAVEEVFYGKSVKAAIKIGEGRGVAVLCAAAADLPVSEYAPTVVKKSVVGVGGAHKTQVQQMVKVILNLPDIPEPDDVADALALAICHCHRHGGETDRTERRGQR